MHSAEQVTDPADPLVATLTERQFSWRLRHRYDDPAQGRQAALDLVHGLLPQSRLLRTEAGVLWLGADEEFTPVYDVWAQDPARIAEQVPALRGLATSLAGAPLMASLLPGEASREAFVDDGSFSLAATTMRLDVTGTLPGESLVDRVELSPMTDAEVTAYRAAAVLSYAAERHAAGESETSATQVAEASFAELLPEGRPGPDQYLFSIRRDGARVGHLWVCRRWSAQAWVYDVEVDPTLRGLGLGAAAMVHAAHWTREQGLPWLGLNVFGQNTHARSLYERLGFVVEESHWARFGSASD